MWLSYVLSRALRRRHRAAAPARAPDTLPLEDRPSVVDTAELIALAQRTERPERRAKARAAGASGGIYAGDDESWTVTLPAIRR